jgi:type IV secretory pathway TrbD component
MLGGARYEMVIVIGALHCKKIGSGGVDRVLLAVDGVQLWAFVKTAQSIRAS